MDSKIKGFIKSIKNKSGNCDEKCIKIKLNSDDDLLLGKMPKHYNMVKVVRSVFHEDSKDYPQFFLDEYLYEL